MVALFHWRRTLLSGHLSRWKKFAFGNNNNSTDVPISPKLPSVAFPVKPTAPQSSELRPPEGTNPRVSGSIGQTLPVRHSAPTLSKTKDSLTLARELHRKYRNGQEELHPPSPTSPPLSNQHDDQNEGMYDRRNARVQLRTLFLCFSSWHQRTVESQERDAALMQQAHKRAAQLLTERILRAWKSMWRWQQYKQRLLRRAQQLHSHHVQRHALGHWKRGYLLLMEMQRRDRQRLRMQRTHVIQAWAQAVRAIKRRRRLSDEGRAYLLVARCVRAVMQWRSVAVRRRQLSTADKIIRRRMRVGLLRSMVANWKLHVFHSQEMVMAEEASISIAMRSSVRRWERAVKTKRRLSTYKLQADLVSYRCRLQSVFRHWCQFHAEKQWQAHCLKLGACHHSEYGQRWAVEMLRRAARKSKKRRQAKRVLVQCSTQLLQLRALLTWKVCVRQLKTLRAWQRLKKQRMLKRVLRQWTLIVSREMRLRQASSTVSERRNHSQLGEVWALWRRRARQQQMIANQRKHRRCMLQRDLLHLWRQWASQRISTRTRMTSHVQRCHERILTGCFRHWLGFVLQRRCHRRLVRLFQRKHDHLRVRVAMRRLRVHARLQSHLRRLRFRMLELALVAWIGNTDRHIRRRALNCCADRFRTLHLHYQGVHTWKENVVEGIHRRQTDRAARRHYRTALARTAFVLWQQVHAFRQRERQLVTARLQAQANQVLMSILSSWRIVAHEWRRRRNLRTKAQVWRNQLLVQRAWNEWKAAWLRARQKKDLRAMARAHFAAVTERKVFQVWHSHSQSRQLLRELSQEFFVGVSARKCQCAIEDWTTWIKQQHAARERWEDAVTFHNQFLVHVMFYEWLKWRTHVREKKLRDDRACRAIARLRAKRAIVVWKTLQRTHAWLRKREHRGASACRTKQLQRGISCWKRLHRNYQCRSQAWKAAIQNHSRRLLQRTLMAWTQHQKQVRSLKARLRVMFGNDDTTICRLVFAQWKTYVRRQRQLRIASNHHKRVLLRMVWRRWGRFRALISAMNKQLFVTSQFLRGNLLRGTYAAWKTFLYAHRRSQARCAQAESYYIDRQARIAVKCLRACHQKAQRAQASVVWNRSRSFRHGFTAWRTAVNILKTKRHQNAQAAEFMMINALSRAFHAWASTAHRLAELGVHKSDAFYRALCVRVLWTQWRRAVHWRRATQIIGIRQTTALAKSTFNTWIAFKNNQRRERALLAASEAHFQFSILGRSWQGWMRYVTHRRSTHRLVVRALGFYAVRVLQRRMFRQWTQFCRDRDERRDVMTETLAFSGFLTVRRHFHTWQRFVDTVRAERSRQQQQHGQLQQVRLVQSVRRWSSQTCLRIHAKQCVRAADKMYRRRRVVQAMRQLRVCKDRRRWLRVHCVKAAAWWHRQLYRRHFSRWKALILWRRQHSRVLRLFRANRKVDAFARWREYCSSKQRGRLLQERAQDHYTLTQRSRAFDRWLLLKRLQQLERVAAAHHRGKILLRMMHTWKHKRCIFQRMRRLFLFQDAMRLQTHFVLWKHVYVARQKSLERLKHAVVFLQNARRQRIWKQWTAFVHQRRLEKETVRLATHFRRRFCTRKYFALWNRYGARASRKRRQQDRAIRVWRTKQLSDAFSALLRYRLLKATLRQRITHAELQFQQKRERLVVNKLRASVLARRRRFALLSSSVIYWQQHHLQRYWRALMSWRAHFQYKNALHQRARLCCERTRVSSCLRALHRYTQHLRAMRTKVHSFRLHYFQSVVHQCFYRWTKFCSLKRLLREFTRARRRRCRVQWLRAWSSVASMLANHRRLLVHALARRRHRCLARCLDRWEDRTTGRWVSRQLIIPFQAARAHTQCLAAVTVWKRLLVLRRARLTLFERRRQRQRDALRLILHVWRDQLASCASPPPLRDFQRWWW